MTACAVLWSIGGVCIKLMPWPGLAVNAARSVLGAAVIWCYMHRAGIAVRWSLRTLPAALALAGTTSLFSMANKMTTAANVVVLQFTAPVFIMLLSFFLYGKRFRGVDIAVVALTLAGVALCFLGQMGAGSLTGNLLAIVSGFTFGAMYLFNGVADMPDRMNAILLGQFLSAVIGLPTLIFGDTPVTAPAVTGIVVLGIFQLGLPYVLLGIALGGCPPLTAALITALEPLLNPIWVFFATGEAPGLLALGGGVLVVATVTVYTIVGDRSQSSAEGGEQ